MYPYIKQQNGTKLLMVEDKPFIMLAGEVHNSNASSVEYMEGVRPGGQAGYEYAAFAGELGTGGAQGRSF